MRNVNTKTQVYIDDDYDEISIFKSLESNSSLKVAKHRNSDEISLFDTGASFSIRYK